VDAEVFAVWLRRQGHRVVRTPNSWWYDASFRVYQAFPFHWSIRPDPGELEQLLRGERAFALRCTTPLEASEGRVSYHAVCETRAYGLEMLDGSARNAVRNGLKQARVEPIPMDRIAEEGWALEADTCQRQGRKVPLTREAWRVRYRATAGLPGWEGWGALVGGRLAACAVCVRIDDWCEVLTQQSLSEYLGARVNNALTFVFTRSMLQRPEVKSVFYSLQSLDAPASVDDFKFRMGYAAKPVRQRVALHPWAERAMGPLAHRLVSRALRRNPGSRLLGKAVGMLRFYLDGKRPAESQVWPTCLATGSAALAREAYDHGGGAGARSRRQRPGSQPAPAPNASHGDGPVR
jgi:hypothetical protein